VRDGLRDVAQLEAATQRFLAQTPAARVEYAAIIDGDSLQTGRDGNEPNRHGPGPCALGKRA